jgi:hypothetical protein
MSQSITETPTAGATYLPKGERSGFHSRLTGRPCW